MTPRPELLSTGDAQREFGWSPQTLRRWADARLVRHVRLPSGHYRFYREDLLALVKPVEPAPRSKAS